MLKAPRQLEVGEIEALLASDALARLASLDANGFPHITPLWFIWDAGSFYMTSIVDRPHVRRLTHDPRAGLIVDTECPERDDGQRPNRQVRVTGHARLFADQGGEWTERITRKYLHGPAAIAQAKQRAANPRIVIELTPEHLIAIASV